MRCGVCRQAPAEIFLRRVDEEDLKLCPDCARSYGVCGSATALELDLGLLLASSTSPDGGGEGRRISPSLCPACGSPSPAAGRGRLGCPACASAFRPELRRRFGLASPGLFLARPGEERTPSAPGGAGGGDGPEPLLETWIDCRREAAQGSFGSPEAQAALRDLPLPTGFAGADPSLLGESRARALVERGLLSSPKAADPAARLALPREGCGWLLAYEDGAGLRLRGRGGPAPFLLLEELLSILGSYPEEAFAFDPEFGYLGRSVEGTGWGIELGVALCLPALAATAGLEAPFRALLAAGFELRGRGLFLEAGEDSAPGEGAGPLFEIVARPGLESPRLVAARLAEAAARLAATETEAALRLRRRDPLALEDQLGRTLGLLAGCRRLGEAESLLRLSTLRLAVAAGLLPAAASPPRELFSSLGPAALSLSLGLPAPPRGHAADEARAAALGARARSIIETRAWGAPEAPRGR